MSPVLFTDRDLGKRFPAILGEAGFNVERYGDHFARDWTKHQGPQLPHGKGGLRHPTWIDPRGRK